MVLSEPLAVTREVVAALDASFNVIHLATMLKIDLFVAKPDPWWREEMTRRTAYQVGDSAAESLWVATPEDIVLHKLCWYRSGGEVSDRQWRDVLGVLEVRGAALDLAYVRRWASHLGVDDLVDRAFAAAAVAP